MSNEQSDKNSVVKIMFIATCESQGAPCRFPNCECKRDPIPARTVPESGERATAALHACEGLDTVDLAKNEKGWLAGFVKDAVQVELDLASALRARCPGNGTPADADNDSLCECQAYEASEQGAPCPPGCCVMADPKDLLSVLNAPDEEGGAVSASGTLHVICGCMEESNGRKTWAVFLSHSPDNPPWANHQVYADEIEGRAKYEAAKLRHFLGQGEEPDILKFDTEPKDAVSTSGTLDAEDAAYWRHAVATNMIRDGSDGVHMIQGEVSEGRASPSASGTRTDG